MPGSALHTTDYARLTPPQARVALGIVVSTLIAGVAVTLSPLGSSNLAPHGCPSDVALYRAEVDRIQGGEGYYQAAATELTVRGYPTRSVFNWRTPLPIWLLGKQHWPALGKALLGAMGLLLIVMAFAALTWERANAAHPHPLPLSRTRARGVVGLPLGCALLLTGPLLLTVLGDLFVMPVLWAGVLMALSVCAYGLGRPWMGVALGLAAIFCRELALPYGLLCAAMAWRQGRRGELAAWVVGLTAWLVFFGWHCWLVSGLITPDARAHAHGWVRFGGAGFVISTAQINAYLLLLPQWVTAIYLLAALVGMAGWSTPLGTRVALITCLYLAAFAAVGQSFNQYWGCLIGPLLCFGAVRSPASVRDLWVAARLGRLLPLRGTTAQ